MITHQDIAILQQQYEKVADSLLELIRCDGFKSITDDDTKEPKYLGNMIE